MSDVPTDPARIARVIDFETTGLPEDEGAAVCEVGLVDVDLGRPDLPVSGGWSSLINPGRPIPPELSAVHHIVDADVEKMPAFDIAERALAARLTEHDVFVAHKADFEQHFFPGDGRRWVDTYKCALRAWPDAPGHSNQVLRFWLGLDVDRERCQPVHRALPDAYVTAHILRKLLFMRPLARLVELSAKPGFLPRLTFGKHRGHSFEEVARDHPDYLEWYLREDDPDPDVAYTARWHLARRVAA